MGANTVLNGVVVGGLGEGSFFISMEHYKKEIKEKLGFDAYPGTLNLKVDEKQTNFLKSIVPIKINEFKKNNKEFGGVSCYNAKIENINGAIIIPDLTKHKDTVEFIAPVHLKSELKIKDGDKVEVELIK